MATIERILAPVRGQAEQYLREAIEKGALKPGDRLIEREICEQLEVSRPLVREIIRRLESDGLVRPLPRGGIAVTVLSLKEASEIYIVRQEMEGLAASLFVENAKDADCRALKINVDKLRTAHESGDQTGLLKAKNRFYAVLSKGSGNAVLQEMLRNIHGRTRLLRGASLSREGRSDKMVQELTDIASAVLAGNGAEARRLTEVHICAARMATETALRERKADAA